jgi:hypothetical protein
MHRHWRLTEEVVFTEIEGVGETEGFRLLLTEEKINPRREQGFDCPASLTLQVKIFTQPRRMQFTVAKRTPVSCNAGLGDRRCKPAHDQSHCPIKKLITTEHP